MFQQNCDMSLSSIDVTDAIQQIATRGDFSCFSTTEVGWAVAAFGDLYKSIVKVLHIKSCQYKVNLWRLLPFFCQLFQAKDGKDAIVTGGPYALLRHFGHKFVLRFRFRWDNVKGMILIGN